MFERFLINFLEGIFYMGLVLGAIVLIIISALPVVFILCNGASPMLMLWYLLILPFDYAVWQTLF